MKFKCPLTLSGFLDILSFNYRNIGSLKQSPVTGFLHHRIEAVSTNSFI